jgi:hypothetical protein
MGGVRSTPGPILGAAQVPGAKLRVASGQTIPMWRLALLALALGGCSLLLDFDDPVIPRDASVPDASPDGADFAEPNDTFDTAFVVGSGSKTGLAILPRGDQDYFRFTLATPRDLILTVRFTQAAGDLDLALYDAARQEVASSTGNDDDEQIVRTQAMGNQLPAGDYFILVYGFDGQYTNQYQLDIEVP